MSATQQFVASPKSPWSRSATANTGRDGSGTINSLYTAGASGGRVDDVGVKAEATTTNGMIRFFKSLDAGVTWRLIRELSVTAATPSATVQAFEGLISDWALVLEANAKLGWAPHNAEAFVVSMNRGGDF